MPLIGFRCPQSAPTAGTENTFDHCVNACPHQCQPRFVLHQIAEREAGNEHKGSMVSPTALSSCPRKLKLTRTEDYYDEPQKLFYATRGGLIHGFLDNCTLPSVVQERRIFKHVTTGPMAPWLISGRVDYYDRELMRIEDIKTMSDKGTYVVFNKGAEEKHIWQLNLYRWLAWGGHLDSPTGPQIFWPVQELKLHFFFMNRVISTGTRYIERVEEWSLKDVNYHRPYGCEVSRVNMGPGRKGKNTWDITFDIPKVPMYEMSKIEHYLSTHGPTRVRSLNDPLYMPPGVLGDKTREWECGFCPVVSRCFEIEQAEAVVTGLNNSAATDGADTVSGDSTGIP